MAPSLLTRRVVPAVMVLAIGAVLVAVAVHRPRPRDASLLAAGQPAIRGPLRVSKKNPRYFETPAGEAVLLVGAHTWDNLQDIARPGRGPSRFDEGRYLAFLERNHHNFVRLWRQEAARWMVEPPGDCSIAPQPWRRTGPGNALDGGPKFDLAAFDEDYFSRLRERVVLARDHGIYVAVMLFNGWNIEKRKGSFSVANPWRGHPFNRDNNVNGIDGDPNHDDSGEETHTLANRAVTQVQDRYVRKVVDTVNDLDNVLYEISNESDVASTDWQVHMIRFIKDYEATKPQRHPVGMTSQWPDGDNATLFASPADWISPNAGPGNRLFADPPPAQGAKVIVADTDHLCGVCGDSIWVWKAVLRGQNPIFMDVYEGATGIDPDQDPAASRWVGLRANLGYALAYVQRASLADMTPRGELASSGFCLANPAADGAYLVLMPDGRDVSVDLSGTPGNLAVEWLELRSGRVEKAPPIRGGARIALRAPFAGPGVLYLSPQR
jgi:Family of unknown function (DUF6298)